MLLVLARVLVKEMFFEAFKLSFCVLVEYIYIILLYFGSLVSKCFQTKT